MEAERLIEDLRCFVPAKDFALSREFYRALGFQEAWSNEKMALFEFGKRSFFLQNYFVKEWAENTVLDLRVSDADAFHAHLRSLELESRFQASVRIGAPKDDRALGIRAGHFVDPAGVLWHFSQALAGEAPG